MITMRKFIFVLIASCVLLAACSPGGNEPVPTAEPSTTSLPSPLPPQVVTSESTSTVGPTVASEVTPTSEPEPSPTVSPVPEPSATTPTNSPIDSIVLEPIITEGMQQITGLTHAFDDRLFVMEQIGRIRIIENGQLLAQPFLDITDRVGSLASEQGLLGLVFHPDYAVAGATGEGHFFVNYTDYSGNTHISRFSVLPNDPNRADPQSEIDYLTQNQPYHNHNGGSLAFGPDGYLYVGLGDGGSANDPLRAGQDISTLLGKVLRLDVDSFEGEYTIPADNPFVDLETARPEIWAYGLRNPWRFSFDRETGDFYITDVGQSQWEEINFQPAESSGGENYGWRTMEGTHCFDASTCDQAGLVLPIFEYDHSLGCSITGGYVYRGQLFPEMAGNYFASDYCSGMFWRLFKEGDTWVQDMLLDSDLIVSSFGEDVNGELYALNYWSGGIYQLQPGD